MNCQVSRLVRCSYSYFSLVMMTLALIAGNPLPRLFAQDVSWRMIVMPDTQYYVSRGQQELDIFNFMTQWIVDNKDAQKIGLVLNEGDIVQTANSDIQWQRAKDAISRLDGHVPYTLTTGNHDHGEANAEHRGTKLNDYFSATDNPLNDPAQGGILAATREPGRLENAFYDFTAPDGRKLLINSLEWSPRDGTVSWADSIASQAKYQDHTAILATHAYLYYDNTRYDLIGSNNSQSWSPYRYPTANDPDGVNDGEDLWQKLIRKNPNYEIVVSGHVLNDQVGRLTSVNDAGENVYQMLYNAQNDANGGNGWMRVFEFLDDGRTVNVRTFSPYLQSLGAFHERSGDDYNFKLTLSQIVPEPSSTLLVMLGLLGISLFGRGGAR